MTFTALPVFTDDRIRLPHDDAARSAQRLALEAILVTRDLPAILRHWKNEFR